MRVTLPKSECVCEPKREHWAELDPKPLTWGQRNRARAAIRQDFYGEFAPALVTMVTTAWSEQGDPASVDAWEPVDAVFGDKVFGEALTLWQDKSEAASVNPTEGPSES
jgi:hypothetical protein